MAIIIEINAFAISVSRKIVVYNIFNANIVYHQAEHSTKQNTFRLHRDFAIQLLYYNKRKSI